jgi:hypothetical protein
VASDGDAPSRAVSQDAKTQQGAQRPAVFADENV